MASPGEGKGATFTVRLPVQVIHSGEVDLERRVADPGFGLYGATNIRLRGVQVLVVDDDIGMPDMDGYDLIRGVRALPTADRANIAAAALTALARSQDRTRALLAGFQAPITKPVDPAELVAVVAALTRRTGKLPGSPSGNQGNDSAV